MIYALNVFNLIPGKDDDYRDYSVEAGKIIYGLGGKVITAGSGPLRELHGDRTRLGRTHTVASLHNDRGRISQRRDFRAVHRRGGEPEYPSAARELDYGLHLDAVPTVGSQAVGEAGAGANGEEITAHCAPEALRKRSGVGYLAQLMTSQQK